MGIFRMPSLGADMEAGTLVEWLKHVGDTVKRGDIVAVVETHKGAIEVEVFEDGPITKLLVEQGAKVPVGTPLAIVGKEEEAIAAPEMAAPLAPSPQQMGPIRIEVPTTPTHAASPAARRRAAELGIELESVKGTGPGGAVTLSDVEAAQRPSWADRMRIAIAAAMARSKREIPHYYLSHTIDVTSASAAVEQFNAAQPPEGRILLSALLIKSVAVALHDFLEFNGFYGAEGFQPSKAVHVGFAVSIRGVGLAAPAIHDVDQLAVADLMTQMRDLVARVRRGTFRSSELADATVTVSSLGDRGVEMLLPIIYPPQVAIVGFGTVIKKPWLVGDSVVARPLLAVTLAADHRASDGHRGALLLRRIDQLLQNPDGLI
ncbi:MAG TPA: dihydrolipoamide acetyltransferase family protein [Sphingomicrobium sp.]|nr:dihydrolipoamide acetyltransferase family protein [Sphingomicrobium sp.]